MVLAEYGIQNVSRAIHPNRLLRQAGMLSLKEDLGREYLDFYTCRAFALADHQIAHIYIHTCQHRLRSLRTLPGFQIALSKT